METICSAQKPVLSILGKAKPSEQGYRLLKYCVQESVDGGVLLFNVLTREMLFLTDEEFARWVENDYLKAHWFVVPENLDEKKYADMVKWVLHSNAKKPSAITTYTILTTTDCNARCFYCFEKDRSRIPMSEETAHKTAVYIQKHCGRKPVSLVWFGGEPLYNWNAMDIICKDLCQAGIEFYSRIATNGYLFDQEAVIKAKEVWNMQNVQITLDGTEAVYNRSKRYIYREGSPYQTVMGNIERLLDAGIRVIIRLNMDLYNAADLMTLVDELAERFAEKKGLTIYAQHIFDAETPMANFRTESQWQERFEAIYRLRAKIDSYGLDIFRGIRKKLKLNSCIADGEDAVLIAPTGEIGLCDQYSDSDFIGHIDHEEFDQSVVKSWKERISEIPECANCVIYPDCVKLKKCPVNSVCYRQHREEKNWQLRRAMLQEYQRWQWNSQADDSDELFC